MSLSFIIDNIRYFSEILGSKKPSAAAKDSDKMEVNRLKYNTFDHDSDDEADNINTAFDINDILEGVVFDEDPVPMELHVVGSRDTDMVMEETGSIISETVEQVS